MYKKYLDKITLNYSAVMNLFEDTDLTENEFGLSGALYYIGFLVFLVYKYAFKNYTYIHIIIYLTSQNYFFLLPCCLVTKSILYASISTFKIHGCSTCALGRHSWMYCISQQLCTTRSSSMFIRIF